MHSYQHEIVHFFVLFIEDFCRKVIILIIRPAHVQHNMYNTGKYKHSTKMKRNQTQINHHKYNFFFRGTFNIHSFR